ncbi:hypothetical protein TWF718_009225 [Orbilia javanica]|uniref:Uncharacterized protein n=1 Tax=Orbilia javanica TaxID=47235 RepID=A0AAN8MZD1_9PEZI
MAVDNRRIRLLSLDFMKRVNRSRPAEDQVEPWQFFDLIGGTSTGGSDSSLKSKFSTGE